MVDYTSKHSFDYRAILGRVCITMTLQEITELLPVLITGFLVGLIGYLNNESKAKRWVDILTSCLICVIAFMILSITDYPYLAKLGISSAVGFLGIDKTLSFLERIFNIRKK